MADAYASLRPVVKVRGSELSPQLYSSLTSMRVVNGIGTPAHARLTFSVPATSEGMAIDMGDELTLKVDGLAGADDWEIFDGLVVSTGIDMSSGIDQILVIEAYDKLFSLGRTSVAKTHVEMTVADIVKSIAGDVGLRTDIKSGFGRSKALSSYQYGTAYSYIDRLVREDGGEWFVKKSCLHIRSRSDAGGAPVELDVGRDLLSFSARFSASDHVDKVTVTGWNVKTKTAIVGSATSGGSKAVSKIGASTVGGVKKSSVGGKAALSIPRPVADKAEADRLAAGIVARREAEMLRARGRVLPNPKVVPGATLRLAGLAGKWDGDYYCTQVEYTWGSQSFDTYFEIGPTEPDSLIDLVGGASSPTSQAMLGGLTIGIVSDNKDPDGWNRVKLTLPYLASDQTTGWARVVQLGAGAKRGWNILPEIDDEVLVGFEHGDIDRPYVLGGLVNGKDKPPYLGADGDLLDGGKVVARTFTSRGGQEIYIADGSAKGEQYIKINTAGNEATLILGAEKIDLQAEGIPIKVFNKQGSFELAKNGDITMQTKGKIDIKAQQDVTIEGMNVNVKAKMGAKVEAVTLDLKGSATAKLEAGAPLTLKGAIVNIN